MLEKFDHLTTLACFAQAQPLRRVRVFDILLGKRGVGGNRWQVAKCQWQQFNNLVSAVIKAD